MGVTRYFTGKPCKHGHLSERNTKSGQCYECHRELDRAAYPERSEKQKAYQAAYRAEHRDEARETSRLWREQNRERGYAKIKEWRLANPDKIVAYRRANRELAAVYSRNRRSRIKGNGGTHTEEDVLAILEKQKFKCAECGKSVKKRTSRHVDHIVPLARGGSNGPTNLQILCSTCNQEKWCIDPLEFAKRRGRLV